MHPPSPWFHPRVSLLSGLLHMLCGRPLGFILQASPTTSLGPFHEKTKTWREWVGVSL